MEEIKPKTKREQKRERAARAISRLRPNIAEAIKNSTEKASRRRQRIGEMRQEIKKAGEKLQALSLAIRAGQVTDWERLAQELDELREKIEKVQALDFEGNK